MELVVHENTWPWGKTVSIVAFGGFAMVDLSFEKNNPGVCYLSGLSVIPTQRKQGYAKALMERAELWCRRSGIFRIDLNSVKEQFVMDFYHKLGFIDIEEAEGFMRMYKLL